VHQGAALCAGPPSRRGPGGGAGTADILAGRVGGVEKVFCSNPAEHIADDVTEEIAVEIPNRLDPGAPIRPELRDFIEANAGLDYTRGLAVDDRSFAAA